MVGTYTRYEYDITNVAVIGGAHGVALEVTPLHQATFA